MSDGDTPIEGRQPKEETGDESGLCKGLLEDNSRVRRMGRWCGVVAEAKNQY